MKPTPNPARPALQADPRIVKKIRRDNAAYAPPGGLLGEESSTYLHQPPQRPQPPRLLELGRPGL
jgi:hypothetical protein